MVTYCLLPMVSGGATIRSNLLKETDGIRMVLDGYAPQLQELFSKALRAFGTSDETISLKALDLFFQVSTVCELITMRYAKHFKSILLLSFLMLRMRILLLKCVKNVDFLMSVCVGWLFY